MRQMRLMTNDPFKVNDLNALGALGYELCVVERVPLEIIANPHNVRDLAAKRDKMGHMFEQSMLDTAWQGEHRTR